MYIKAQAAHKMSDIDEVAFRCFHQAANTLTHTQRPDYAAELMKNSSTFTEWDYLDSGHTVSEMITSEFKCFKYFCGDCCVVSLHELTVQEASQEDAGALAVLHERHMQSLLLTSESKSKAKSKSTAAAITTEHKQTKHHTHTHHTPNLFRNENIMQSCETFNAKCIVKGGQFC